VFPGGGVSGNRLAHDFFQDFIGAPERMRRFRIHLLIGKKAGLQFRPRQRQRLQGSTKMITHGLMSPIVPLAPGNLRGGRAVGRVSPIFERDSGARTSILLLHLTAGMLWSGRHSDDSPMGMNSMKRTAGLPPIVRRQNPGFHRR